MAHRVSKDKQHIATTGQSRDASGHVAEKKDIKPLDAVSDSVCMINMPKRFGTGFRVGDKYIMTANHVIEDVDLHGRRCYADFNIDDKVTPKKFGLKEVVYRNKDLDVAVVELQFNNLKDLPKPFMHFCPPVYQGSFQLIGHPLGIEKEHSIVDKTFDQSQFENKDKLSKLEQQSQEIAELTYGLGESSKDSYLFHCKFTTGACGSPGVVFSGGNAYVTTMLIRGHPWWYIGQTVRESVLFEWNDEDCIEEGVNMKSLFDAMQSENKTLSDEVFKFGVMSNM